jgi:hypothetical protein
MCEGNLHAREESMQEAQEGKPNHVMVRFLERVCNGQ